MFALITSPILSASRCSLHHQSLLSTHHNPTQFFFFPSLLKQVFNLIIDYMMSTLANLFEERRQRCEADQARKDEEECEQRKQERKLLRAKKRARKQELLNDPTKAEQAKYAEQCHQELEKDKQRREVILRRFQGDRIARKEKDEQEKEVHHRRAKAKAQREANMLANFQDRKKCTSQPESSKADLPSPGGDDDSDENDWLYRTAEDVYGPTVPPHSQGRQLGTSSPRTPSYSPLTLSDHNGTNEDQVGPGMKAKEPRDTVSKIPDSQKPNHDHMDMNDTQEKYQHVLSESVGQVDSARRLHQELVQRSQNQDSRTNTGSPPRVVPSTKHDTPLHRHRVLLSIRANRPGKTGQTAPTSLTVKAEVSSQPLAQLPAASKKDRLERRKADNEIASRIVSSLTEQTLPSQLGFRASDVPDDILREVCLARSILNKTKHAIFVYLKTRFAGRKVLDGMNEGHVVNLEVEGRRRRVVDLEDQIVQESFVNRWYGCISGSRKEGYLGGYCRL